MTTTYERVAEFHRAFGHPIALTPLIPDVKLMKFRTRFILEETVELIQALGARHEGNQHLRRAMDLIERARDQVLEAKDYEFNDVDLVGVADSLGDLDYVVNGAGLVFGIPMPEIGEEIHSSNMSKAGADGKPIYNEEGKIQKGPNYRKPDLAFILFPEPLTIEEDPA